MARDLAKKEQAVAELKERFVNDETIVLAQNKGLTVAAFTQFRLALRKAGGSAKVPKNTLARLALKGTKFEALEPLFAGPVVIASSKDAVAAAKITHEFARGSNDKLVIIGGAMGSQILDAKAVETLAKLPSLDELRGKLVGLIAAPATGLARVIGASPAQLARVINARVTKGE